MPSCVLNRRIPVHITQLSQTEAIAIITRIRETIHNHRRRLTVKHLTHPTIQLIVGDRCPKWLLLKRHWLHIHHTRALIRIVVGGVDVILIGGTVGWWWCFC